MKFPLWPLLFLFRCLSLIGYSHCFGEHRPIQQGIKKHLHVRYSRPFSCSLMRSSKFNKNTDGCMIEHENASPPVMIHHVALKTRNITTAMQFYSLLGFEVASKFRTGPARAAWLELEGGGCRLEVIEVPSFMLQEEPGVSRQRAPDVMKRQGMLGYNHLALDVTKQIIADPGLASLQDWMDAINLKSFKMFGKTLRIALLPRQQIVGQSVYELSFIYDADGCLVEFLHHIGELPQRMDPGWQPWNGQGFVGSPG